MSKLIYNPSRPYTEDLKDLVEDEIEKGRGPDKKPRKRRGSGQVDHEAESRKHHDLADNFENSRDPEMQAEGRKHRELAQRHEAEHERMKKERLSKRPGRR